MEIFKKAGWYSMIISGVLIIVGILLLNYPEEILKTISLIMGITVILLGLFKTLNVVSNEQSILGTEYEIAIGCTCIIVGLIFIIYSTLLTTIFRLIIGVWILYTSFLKLSYAMKLKSNNVKSWIYVLVLGLIIFVCGTIIVMVPGIVMSMIGALIITYAVIDIINTIFIMKNISKIL